MIFVVYIQPLYVCVLICLCFCSCNWVLPTGPTPCCVCDITGIKRDWIWISYICKWIVSQYWILWCNCQSSLCETFDCWTFCCVSSFNLLDGQCLDYVILCDYLCYMWIISQCWILWCIWQSSLYGTFDCWNLFCRESSLNLVTGKCLDYVILCGIFLLYVNYKLYWISWCIWQCSLFGTLDCWNLFVCVTLIH